MAKHKIIFGASAALLVGLFFIGMNIYKNNQFEKSSAAVSSNQNSLIRDYSPSIGSPLYRVTLVEFLDPECETCRIFHPIVKNILKKHDGYIHYVVRYAPFHPNSKLAIKILAAAKAQGKYWEALDLFFEKLPDWGDHHQPRPELLWTYLPTLGLDVEKVKKDIEDEKLDEMIQQEISDGADFGVRQTPTFFVNGKPLQSFGQAQLEAAIQFALDSN